MLTYNMLESIGPAQLEARQHPYGQVAHRAMPMRGSLFDLSGRVALVTGASRGIGRAIALRLAEHGADVVVSARTLAACQRVAEDIAARRYVGWGQALAVEANVSHSGVADSLLSAAEDRFGPVDIVVANAAINIHVGPTEDLTEAVLRKTIDANVISLYSLVRRAAPGMKARGWGRIVCIASTAGLIGSGRSLSYAMTKAAGMQAMRTLAVELGPFGIRCNAVAPGMMDTDMVQGLKSDPEGLAPYLNRSPVGAIGSPDDVAAAVVFLAAESGSHVNGHALVVDGGHSVA
jgi:NAD(P)-dependent dehydrogenase (short-subunit alcohol dehydrogenase family)